MRLSPDEVALIGLADEVDVPWLGGPVGGLDGRTFEGEQAARRSLLHRLLAALREERVRHCVLRDPETIAVVPGCSRLSVLVHPEDLRRLDGLLALLGFVPLTSHSRRRAFLAYDRDEDVWWKLEVTSNLSFDRPGRVVSGLARACLARRRDEPPFFVPSPEDELVAVLLRAALEHRLTPSRRRQLEELALRVQDPAYLEATLDMLWLPRTDVRALLRQIREGDWSALLARRQEVADRHLRRAPWRTRIRRFAGRVLRPFARRVRSVLPGALVVAVVAPGRVASADFSGALERRLYGGARLVRVPSKPTDPARPLLSLPVRVARAWGRCWMARWHRRRGRFVILEGPTRSAPGASFGDRLRDFVVTRACPRPDLVLVLAAPGQDPRLGEREGHAGGLGERPGSRRRPSRPEVARLDPTEGPQAVLREALACIWEGVLQRRRGEAVP